MTERKNAQELLEKYQAGTVTEEEKAWIETWYARQEDQATMVLPEELATLEWESRQALAQQLRPALTTRLWPAIAVAAALLVVISTAAYWLAGNKKAVPPPVAMLKQDRGPGSNKAILTLAGGQQINLDAAQTGQVASQSGITITKTADGQLIYTTTPNDSSRAFARATGFNTVTTPRGGQYQVILPDGTHVWLNAASSLRYPVAFTGNTRQVMLSGEAYFEAAVNKARPFQVLSRNEGRNQLVEVLGTHFNINAYDDEADTRTTLIEGAVKVSQDGDDRQKILKPGQQAILNGKGLQVQEVDTEEAIAWKNGYFVFNEENLASIMRKIARWYNVEISYKEQGLLAEQFNGTVSRYGQVSQVIKVLELTQAAHFSLTGNKIMVSR